MKIVKLSPAFKDYLWGGDKLRSEYNKQTDIYPLAESWELSCHENGLTSVVSAETSLLEYIASKGGDVLGTKAQRFDDFPILLKLIDAKENLSLQVHPDDRYAIANEGQYGKTEAWYILESEPNAKIIYGLSEDITAHSLRKCIENNTIMDYVNQVEVAKGDLFIIQPGMLHGIGEGIVIAEIQQSSDITYRVYDYNRVGPGGEPRQLHVDRACDVVVYTDKANDSKQIEPMVDGITTLVECEYFCFYRLDVDTEATFACDSSSFQSLLCIEGDGEIVCEGESLAYQKGDCFFLEAGVYEYTVGGSSAFLKVTL